MFSSLNSVSPGCVSMVRRLLVMSGLVVFSRLRVVMGGMRQMLCGPLVWFCRFLRHRLSSLGVPPYNLVSRLDFITVTKPIGNKIGAIAAGG